MSSVKAEYRGATIATCEAIWLKQLLQDLKIEVPTPILIYCDNLNNMRLAKNPIFHARTKHIEVHYHFVRKRVLSGEVELWYIHTDRQVADIFTKALGLDKLWHFSELFGLQHLDVPHLMGRTTGGTIGEENKSNQLVKAEGKERVEEDAELTEEVETSGRAGGGTRVKKNRAN